MGNVCPDPRTAMSPVAPPAGRPETVLILGGGLMGLAVAHQLARHGLAVQVLSRRRSEAAGFVAAGMLAPHAEGLSGALLALGQASLERIPAWVAQVETDSGLGCGMTGCSLTRQPERPSDGHFGFATTGAALQPIVAVRNLNRWRRGPRSKESIPLGFGPPQC